MRFSKHFGLKKRMDKADRALKPSPVPFLDIFAPPHLPRAGDTSCCAAKIGRTRGTASVASNNRSQDTRRRSKTYETKCRKPARNSTGPRVLVRKRIWGNECGVSVASWGLAKNLHPLEHTYP
jgi:hypothetical protein